MDEVHLGGAGKVADGEHRPKGFLKAGNIADRGVGTQKLLVGFALHLDQVRHLHDFVNVAEDLADALLCGLRVSCLGRHVISCRFGRIFFRIAAKIQPDSVALATKKSAGRGCPNRTVSVL